MPPINPSVNNIPTYDPDLRVGAVNLNTTPQAIPPATVSDTDKRWMIRALSIATDDSAANVTLYVIDADGVKRQVREWRVTPSRPVDNEGPFTSQYGEYFALASDDGRPDDDQYEPAFQISYDPMDKSRNPRSLG